jgi:hypothetical protein
VEHRDLQAGDPILEHIRIVALLGRDEAGSVWEAIHAFEGRVAVKVFTAVPGPVPVSILDAGRLPDGRTFIACSVDEAQALLRQPTLVPQVAPAPECPYVEVAAPPAAPRAVVSYEHLHEQLSCHPPLKRNWFPVYAAAAVALVGALFASGVL